jgi:hypothetical protein
MRTQMTLKNMMLVEEVSHEGPHIVSVQIDKSMEAKSRLVVNLELGAWAGWSWGGDR